MPHNYISPRAHSALDQKILRVFQLIFCIERKTSEERPEGPLGLKETPDFVVIFVMSFLFFFYYNEHSLPRDGVSCLLKWEPSRL